MRGGRRLCAGHRFVDFRDGSGARALEPRAGDRPRRRSRGLVVRLSSWLCASLAADRPRGRSAATVVKFKQALLIPPGSARNEARIGLPARNEAAHRQLPANAGLPPHYAQVPAADVATSIPPLWRWGPQLRPEAMRAAAVLANASSWSHKFRRNRRGCNRVPCSSRRRWRAPLYRSTVEQGNPPPACSGGARTFLYLSVRHLNPTMAAPGVARPDPQLAASSRTHETRGAPRAATFGEFLPPAWLGPLLVMCSPSP